MKLTLNIRPSLIEQLKEVAKRRNTSLSKVTEILYEGVLDSEKEPFKMKSLDEMADLVKRLSISGDSVPDFNHKAEYHKHLEEKYGL